MEWLRALAGDGVVKLCALLSMFGESYLMAAVSVIVAQWLIAKAGSYLRIMLILAIVGLPGWFFCTSDDFFVGYGAATFVGMGVYPMLFKHTDRFFHK